MKLRQAPYRSLFVPLDGSPFAEQALPLALSIARNAGALLRVGLVHHPVPALATALEVPEIEAQLDQESRQREQGYLNGVVERLRHEANVPVTALLLDGPVADALEEEIEKSGTDLVVMTTHGRGPLSRFWLGSVADQLMRRLHTSVLLVRPAGERSIEPRLRRILIALDGSPFAEQAIGAATALGMPFDAEFVLLMVVEPTLPVADPAGLMILPVSPDTEQKRCSAAEQYLSGLAGRLRSEGVTVTTHVAADAVATAAILERAEALHADLVALASHGAGGFERLVIGSVADKVIRGSLHPTLVVRPPRSVL